MKYICICMCILYIFPNLISIKIHLTPAESGRSRQVILQEGAPINDVKDEE